MARARCLLAKVGLDGHQRGVQVVAQAWRDAGYEVIYIGLRNSPALVAAVAIQEDVDVVGLSILSGAHLHLVAETRKQLDAAGGSAIPLIVGGVFPLADVRALVEAGAAAVLRPGTSLRDIVGVVEELVGSRRAAPVEDPSN